ncbi:Zinc finger BED domain-containing protein 4 [Aphelenchoides avenae]|nr:Zinc finger BED domain-containing protein 4 [Aphelenchus avenae]
MGSVNERLFSIGLFKRVSAEEAHCIVCTAKGPEPKVFKTRKYASAALLKHLDKHEEYLKKYEALKENPPTIKAYVVSSMGSVSALDRRVLHLIACANLSFNVVNHLTFRALFQSTKSSEVLKEKTHYREHVLLLVYKYVVRRVSSDLDKSQYLSFTSYVWAGPMHSFISLTVHGITKDWVRFKYVLAVREFDGSHTSERTQEMVCGLLREWSIDRERVHVILHDQASSMIGAFEDTDLEDADCGAHKINLIVRNSLFPKEKGKVKVTPVTTLLASCRNIVSHFRHSHQAYEKLRALQKQLEAKEHNLVQDVETRWDATFLMIDRLVEQKSALNAYCAEHCYRLLLSGQDWAKLEEIRSFLRPFVELNKVVCRDSSPISTQIAVGEAIATELKLYKGDVLKDEIRRMIVIHNKKFVGLEQYR